MRLTQYLLFLVVTVLSFCLAENDIAVDSTDDGATLESLDNPDTNFGGLVPLCPECPTCSKCASCPTCPDCPTCQICTKCASCPDCPTCQICPKCASCPTCPDCPTCQICPKCASCPTCPDCPACNPIDPNQGLLSKISELGETIELNNKNFKKEISDKDTQIAHLDDQNEKLKAQIKQLEKDLIQSHQKTQSCLTKSEKDRKAYEIEHKSKQNNPSVFEFYFNLLIEARSKVQQIIRPKISHYSSLIATRSSEISDKIKVFYKERLEEKVNTYVHPYLKQALVQIDPYYKSVEPQLTNILSQIQSNKDEFLKLSTFAVQKYRQELLTSLKSSQVPYPEETLDAIALITGFLILLLIGPIRIFLFSLKLVISLISIVLKVSFFLLFFPILIPKYLFFGKSSKKSKTKDTPKRSVKKTEEAKPQPKKTEQNKQPQQKQPQQPQQQTNKNKQQSNQPRRK